MVTYGAENLTSSKWGKVWFEVKFDLEGKSQSPPKPIGILTKVFYTFGSNLAILADPKLSRQHTSDWRKDWRTHTHTDTHADTGDDNARGDKTGLG